MCPTLWGVRSQRVASKQRQRPTRPVREWPLLGFNRGRQRVVPSHVRNGVTFLLDEAVPIGRGRDVRADLPGAAPPAKRVRKAYRAPTQFDRTPPVSADAGTYSAVSVRPCAGNGRYPTTGQHHGNVHDRQKADMTNDDRGISVADQATATNSCFESLETATLRRWLHFRPHLPLTSVHPQGLEPGTH